jgi:enoyl-CoA hydratase
MSALLSDPVGIYRMILLAINDSADAAAYPKPEAEYVKLFSSEDFLEGRKAEAENRPPTFHGR